MSTRGRVYISLNFLCFACEGMRLHTTAAGRLEAGLRLANMAVGASKTGRMSNDAVVPDHSVLVVVPFSEVTQVRKQTTALLFSDTIVLGTRSRQSITFSGLRNRQVRRGRRSATSERASIVLTPKERSGCFI